MGTGFSSGRDSADGATPQRDRTTKHTRRAFAVRFAGATSPNGPVYRLLAFNLAHARREAERLSYVGYQDIVPYAERYTRPRASGR